MGVSAVLGHAPGHAHQTQAENMNCALGDVSVFAGGNSAGNVAGGVSQPETFEIAKITNKQLHVTAIVVNQIRYQNARRVSYCGPT